MRFTKMQGLGNDYLYVYGDVPENVADVSRRLSDRHFGAGSDGMIFIGPSKRADFEMRIFNADGSEAMMCGNGIRCVGKFVYDKGYTDKTRLTVGTLSGIKTLELFAVAGKVRRVSVGMGKVEVSHDVTLDVPGGQVVCTPVSVGNPHAVIFVPDAGAAPVDVTGPALERHPSFPGGVNVEFVGIVAPNELRMRVWERGSGITMACGTGACASAAAAVKKRLCDYDKPICVGLDGGALGITVSRDFTVTMTGPAETVYEGETDIC
ncbi:MAG: diaminopimelate epimerase [Clostridia bacterium]|nr:diaminopimelate epimerase [Clostridia bacterium]